MAVVKGQIRQITSESNITSVADVYSHLEESFKDIRQELMEAELDASLGYEKNQNACLTLRDYEKVIIYSILCNNNQRIINDYPYTDEMLKEKIAPHPIKKD